MARRLEMCGPILSLVIIPAILTTALTVEPRSDPLLHQFHFDLAFHHQEEDHSLGRRQNEPIIGVLAQEIPLNWHLKLPDVANFSSYIAASYVKYLESAGARVVPVLTDRDSDHYDFLFRSLNGLLLPGGGGAPLNQSQYGAIGKYFYNKTVTAFDEYGDFFPIWGTCLGLELLATISADNPDQVLTRCSSNDKSLPLNVRDEAWNGSTIGRHLPQNIKDLLTSENITSNFHQWCLTPERFHQEHLNYKWRLLATSDDDLGLEFVALMESSQYPIWASQFHPEKNVFEWRSSGIAHNSAAIEASTAFARFFVDQARQNGHTFPDRPTSESYLIYNYSPAFTGKSGIDLAFEQVYFFH